MTASLGKNPRESTKAKMREFANLWRGGPDEVRGNQKACWLHMHPDASNKSAEVRGSEYLNHPYTQEYLRTKTDAVAEKADITQDRVLKEVARCGMYDMRRLFDADGNPLPPGELDDDIAAAVVGLKVSTILGDEDNPAIKRYEYKLADKGPAQEKLMKYLGLYEKDNKQRAKSLAELIAEVRGSE